jgi:hypothetical protein
MINKMRSSTEALQTLFRFFLHAPLSTRIHLAHSRRVSHTMTSKGTSKSSSRAKLAREIKALEMQRRAEALDQLKRIAIEREREASKLTTTLYQARVDAKQWLQCGILNTTEYARVVLDH